jgi:transcriptional regulator with XRE-family HTH domain
MLDRASPRPGAGPSWIPGQAWGRTVDLQTLIARKGGGRSYRELAIASGLTKQTIATNAKPSPSTGQRFPTAATMLGLARGLDVDPESVGLAVLETMGVIAPDRARPPLLLMLPPREVLARLTPDDVDTVVRLVNLLADRTSGRPLAPVPAGATQGRAPVLAATEDGHPERAVASA